MINYRIVIAKDENQLHHYQGKADEYIKREAVQKFAEELVKHIEPRWIDEQLNFGSKTIIFTFDFRGGSLPEHMEQDI